MLCHLTVKSKLSIYAPEARVVKKIFELYTTGYTPKDIVQFIKSEYSYNKDRLWTINSIKSILNNPVYTGTMVWNKKVVKEIQENIQLMNMFILSLMKT